MRPEPWLPVPRDPGSVPDAPDVPGIDVSGGADSDGDGRPDTLLSPHGDDLLVHTDLDGDGLADRTLRIGPHGDVEEADPEPSSLLEAVLRFLRLSP